jgi:hypothetical protein
MHKKLNFTLAETSTRWRTYCIAELCDYLTATLLEPLMTRDGAKWDSQFMDFFSFDNACEPLEPTGTIRFRVPALFAGRVGALESAILAELSRLRIQTGPLAYERDPKLNNVKSIAIPILENPGASVAPPVVNMSHTRGCVVLRDLLGYQRVNGRYEFTARDLVTRVSAVTEDRIASCTASPVKGREGLRRTPSPMSMKAVRRCLEEIRQFGNWALTHNHHKLAAI